MPARLYAFVPEEQDISNAEREELIKGLALVRDQLSGESRISKISERILCGFDGA